MMDWLKNEIEKDNKELENEKLKFLNEIKKIDKTDIIPVKKESKKLTLWMKIKKVLMG
jgi:cell shape-determining protein MreC